MKNKINVLYLINYAGSGGSEMYLKILADNMKENVNPILVYNEEGLLVKEFENRNIKCIKLKMNSPFDFKAAKKLSMIVKEHDIDIIHSNYLRENYISVLSKLFYGCKAKIVYTCHFNTYDSKIISLFNKVFYKKISKIISISNEVTKSLIKSGSDKKKIELIYHGVKNKELIAPDEEYKKEFGVEDKLVISCASRFSKEKGNEFLIKSISKLKERYDDEDKEVNFKVLLANGGETLDVNKELVNSLYLEDIIKFVGYQNDMEKFYMATDIYVTSSSSEGLGLATIESLSYGIPNVVTNIGGLTEIVNDKTNCGLVCEYDDVIKMTDNLYTLLNDEELRNKLKENAKKNINENFSINSMIEKTLNVYNEILK